MRSKFKYNCALWLLLSIAEVFTQLPKDYVVFPKVSLQEDSIHLALKIELEEKYKNYLIQIKKKTPFYEQWESSFTLPFGTNSFSGYIPKSNVYEFGLICSSDTISSYGYYLIGEKNEIETYWGNVLILVDSSIAKDINDELNQFLSDLENDGWYAEIRLVPRTETYNPIEFRKVKRIVNAFKRKWKENFKVLLLVGRIAVPYTGNYAFDGHIDHAGAFPSDLCYVVDDSLLTDGLEFNTSASREANWNVPFDTKFDETTIPTTISIAVGRIDFFNLNDFKVKESDLIRNYFTKNHKFRFGLFESSNNGLIDDGFGTQSEEIFSANAFMNFYAICDTIIEGKLFENLNKRYFRFAYACNSGSYTSIWSAINSEQCAKYDIRATFLFLFGSYNWDWDTKNNLLRSALASSPNVLITAWIGRPFWHFHHFAFGFPFANSFIATANNSNLYQSTSKYGTRGMHLEILGDPTLRMEYNAPVSNFWFEIDSNKQLLLRWSSPKDTTNLIGYQISKKRKVETIYKQVAVVKKESEYFLESSVNGGTWNYQIKALYLRRNKFGSYINPSIGRSIEIQIK